MAGQLGLGDVWNVAAARIDLAGLEFVDVEPGDVEPVPGELHGQRQADVAEPDNADPRAFRADAIEEGLVVRVRGHLFTVYRAGTRAARSRSAFWDRGIREFVRSAPCRAR